MQDDTSSSIRNDGQTPPTNPQDMFALALSKSDESFPVLKAFQGFLDQERERARRKVVTLSVCFTVAIVVISLVFVALFGVFFGRMINQGNDQQAKILEYISSTAAAERQDARERRDQEELRQLREQLRTALELRAQTAPAQTQPPANSTPNYLTKEDLLEVVKTISAAQAPAPAPAPAAVEPAPKPQPQRPLRGVVSSSSRAEQEARIAAEEKERQARAAERKAAAAKEAAAKNAKASQSAKSSAASGASTAKKPAAGKSADSTQTVRENPDGSLSIKVRKVGNMKLPEGTESDEIFVLSENGAAVPLRTLMPAKGAK